MRQEVAALEASSNGTKALVDDERVAAQHLAALALEDLLELEGERLARVVGVALEGHADDADGHLAQRPARSARRTT
jgi:hypothetical protein